MRLAVSLLAGALLLATLPALAPPSTLPLAAAGTLPGAGSFGVRIDAPAGVADLDLFSTGPRAGSTDGVGVFLFRADKSFWFGIGIAGSLSTDRTILTVGGATDLAGAEALAREAGVGLRLASGETDATCTYNCIYFQLRSAGGAPATWYAVAWASGTTGPTTVEVRGPAGVTASLTTGTSHALGDPEVQDGLVNVQVQRRIVGYDGLGAKAMVEASATASVGSALYGFWGAANVKFACAGACLSLNTFDPACTALTLGPCDPTRLAWQGPGGAGEGRLSYSFLGLPPGTYTFTVDRKVDAYQPGRALGIPPALVFLYENASQLNVADVALPP